ncbi:hypothetical protein L9F63_023263, partial [Diploptera punctata]
YHFGNGGNTATFDLFDSESGQDLTLSPQTFTSSTEAFINDNSDSLGVPGDTDTVGSTEDAKGVADSSKLAVKKPRPKASSPNRQGPQQCQFKKIMDLHNIKMCTFRNQNPAVETGKAECPKHSDLKNVLRYP